MSPVSVVTIAGLVCLAFVVLSAVLTRLRGE